MIVDYTLGMLCVELQEIVGDDWPTSGYVTVLAIPGGAEVFWTTQTKHHVVKTNAVHLLHDPQEADGYLSFCSVMWEDGDDIPRMGRELEDRRGRWIVDQVYAEKIWISLELDPNV